MAGNSSTLEAGTIISNGKISYRIEDVLGRGGFGITYLAVAEIQYGNVTAEAKFAIKEHFPANYCQRAGIDVEAKEGCLDEYNRSLADFIAEARELHALGTENDNIVKVNEVFSANGTAYYVMQYINGKSLEHHVLDNDGLEFEEAMRLLLPIFDSVAFLHKSRINHLDIKPDNIMLHEDANGVKPILIDFGQSVHFKKSGGKATPKKLYGLSDGYSPLELYAGIREFNPAADIYALAATLLFALTAEAPEAASKISLDDVRRKLTGIIDDDRIEAICKAMRKSDSDRTSSVAAFKHDLGAGRSGSRPKTRTIGAADEESFWQRYGKMIIAALIGALVVAAAVVALPKACGSDRTTEGAVVTDTVKTDSTESGNEPVTQNEPTKENKPVAENEPIAENKPMAENKPTVENEPAKQTQEVNAQPVKTPRPVPAVSSGTLHLDFATWTGGIRNGKMDGNGTLVFHSRHRVPGSSEYANPGERVEGSFSNGSIEFGKLYDSDGNLIKTII